VDVEKYPWLLLFATIDVSSSYVKVQNAGWELLLEVTKLIS
jgi:hypothetical protein